jgi:hypothetical protein
MIYLKTEHCSLSGSSWVSEVYEVDFDNVEELYLNFLRENASKERIKINVYGDIANHKDHHRHLSSKEYKQTTSDWNKFLKNNDIGTYIIFKLAGKKVNYKQIIKF